MCLQLIADCPLVYQQLYSSVTGISESGWRRKVMPFLIRVVSVHSFPYGFKGWLQSSLWLERNFPVFVSIKQVVPVFSSVSEIISI